MNVYKCPICGNPGIPDYYKEEVVCPHCGSDLKIYKTISEFENHDNASVVKAKKFKILSIMIPVVVAIIIGVSFYLFNNKNQGKLLSEIELNKERISYLEDTILYLKSQISTTLPAIVVEKEPCSFDYVVVYNDSPWGIIHKFFGTRNDWTEISKRIAIDNDLWDDNTQGWKMIHPGQVLKIKFE